LQLSLGEKIVLPTGEDATVEFNSHKKMDDANKEKKRKRSIALFFLAMALAPGAQELDRRSPPLVPLGNQGGPLCLEQTMEENYS